MEKTDDYEKADERFEKKYRRNMLITLIIAAFFCFFLPVIVITGLCKMILIKLIYINFKEAELFLT